MSKYQLYTYDLWGNDKDGYNINDYYVQNEFFDILDDMTEQQIISLIDFTKPSNIEIANHSPENEIYFVTIEEGRPVCELRLVGDL